MSHSRRDDEHPKRHFRSERCFFVNGAWYITTREGVDVGPYQTREAANAGSEALTAILEGVEDPQMALTFIREFARRREP